MGNDNINNILKWVQPDYEKEITEVFELSMKVKDLSPETKEIAEKYFFSELIRMHRVGEGAPFISALWGCVSVSNLDNCK